MASDSYIVHLLVGAKAGLTWLTWHSAVIALSRQQLCQLNCLCQASQAHSCDLLPPPHQGHKGFWQQWGWIACRELLLLKNVLWPCRIDGQAPRQGSSNSWGSFYLMNKLQVKAKTARQLATLRPKVRPA
jgi:hypothetical protein